MIYSNNLNPEVAAILEKVAGINPDCDNNPLYVKYILEVLTHARNYGDYNHFLFESWHGAYMLFDRVVKIGDKYILYPWYTGFVEDGFELDLSKIRVVKPLSTDGGKFIFL